MKIFNMVVIVIKVEETFEQESEPSIGDDLFTSMNIGEYRRSRI